MTILLKIWLAETLLLAALALLIGASNVNAEDSSYLCQFPQEWKPDHTFEDPDSPGTFYTCRTYANWVTGSGGGPTGVDASWTCAGSTKEEQYHVGTVSKFGCCGPSGRSACCSQIVTWRPGAEDECSSSPPVPATSTPSPPSPEEKNKLEASIIAIIVVLAFATVAFGSVLVVMYRREKTGEPIFQPLVKPQETGKDMDIA